MEQEPLCSVIEAQMRETKARVKKKKVFSGGYRKLFPDFLCSIDSSSTSVKGEGAEEEKSYGQRGKDIGDGKWVGNWKVVREKRWVLGWGW